ncbi:MAG: AI-2E family transporter, partial [Acidobacteriota bacterium]|nr:AI-2E family transporter [Acidobacteriota bacterium]
MRDVVPVPFVPTFRQTSLPNTLVTGAILIGALYFGRDIFVPLALAVLLSFVLAPMANRLQRLRVGRVPSVLFVVIVAFAAILGVVGYVGTQVAQLATDLPSYESTIQAKITALRGAGAADGTLARAGNVLQNLDNELNRATANKPGSLQSPPSAVRADEAKPIPVEVHQPPPS